MIQKCADAAAGWLIRWDAAAEPGSGHWNGVRLAKPPGNLSLYGDKEVQRGIPCETFWGMLIQFLPAPVSVYTPVPFHHPGAGACLYCCRGIRQPHPLQPYRQ